LIRNVGDRAYVMSHAAAEACTVHTAAGCRAWHWRVSGDGYSAGTSKWPSTGRTCCASSGSSGKAASTLY